MYILAAVISIVFLLNEAVNIVSRRKAQTEIEILRNTNSMLIERNKYLRERRHADACRYLAEREKV